MEIDKLMDNSKKVISFWSSFLAGAFIAVSFLLINFFIPYGQEKWSFNWFWLSIFIFLYVVIYYFIGLLIMGKFGSEGIQSFKINFWASFLVSICFSVILLFKFDFLVVLFSLLITFIFVSLICYKLSLK